MTGNKFLLDTNIIVAWLNGDKSIADKIDKADLVFIPVIVSGELFYGAMHSSHVQKNFLKITTLIRSYPTLPIDEGTSIEYAKIKAELRIKGKPIPENDIWIAALANQHNLVLITRDKHFKEISDISLKKW